MSTTAPQPVTTPIPVPLSEPEFDPLLLPHLSMPKRGPKCKLGYHRVCNLIVWVLYTGMQWKCLPIPTDTQGKPAIPYTTRCLFHKSYASIFWRRQGVKSGALSCPVALLCLVKRSGPCPFLMPPTYVYLLMNSTA
jgi:hypothetical protein